MKEYLQTFVREADEQITDLNNALLALESDPTDREAMGAIFRTAHTLKGNFGAMGFENASDLAHAVEDLLDAIRNDQLAVTPGVMDLVFDGIDRIETIVEDIDETGGSSVDPTATIRKLRATIEDGADTATPTEPATDPGLDAVEARLDAGDSVFRVAIDVGDGMKSVDAMLAIGQIEDALELVETRPSRDDIEDGAFADTFEVYVCGDGATAVEDTVTGFSTVDDATVEPVSPAEFQDDDPVEESVGTHTAGAEIKSIRVDVDQLDSLYGLVEQLVTSRIKLRRSIEDGDDSTARDNLDELDKITSSLQNTVMDMRLIPLKKVVGKFPRLVRDLAREEGKQVDFEMIGDDIELDRTILTEIGDPLMHILRNAVDHGIEEPAVRESNGKPSTGSVVLRARRDRDQVTIQVEDDGSGLDVDRIKAQAIESGVRTEAELDAMDDSAVHDLIFLPGFSTTDEVTDVSGRGVGMDVVHNTVKRLDGSVSVESDPGHGSTVTLRLPVTMAIVNVLFVHVGDREYGVPIKTIDEISDIREIRTVNGNPVIDHDDTIYPLIDLAERLDAPNSNGDGMLLRIRESERPVALRCDAVDNQEEVVVKPLEGPLSGTSGLSGTAILGDGNIVPILDVVTL